MYLLTIAIRYSPACKPLGFGTATVSLTVVPLALPDSHTGSLLASLGDGDGEFDDEGDTLALGLTDGETELDGLAELDGDRLADGETDGDPVDDSIKAT